MRLTENAGGDLEDGAEVCFRLPVQAGHVPVPGRPPRRKQRTIRRLYAGGGVARDQVKHRYAMRRQGCPSRPVGGVARVKVVRGRDEQVRHEPGMGGWLVGEPHVRPGRRSDERMHRQQT